MKIIFVLIFLSVSSLIDAKHHHHHCHQYFDCDLGQIWDQESCSCKCISDESSCKNREIFDDYFCTCFCPYSRHHKCSDKNKQWSYINCDCVCKDEKARKACTNGRWSKSQCKCIPNTTTTSTTVKLTTTQQINTTQSVIESSTTQSATKISTTQTITNTTATQKVTNQQTTPVSITTIQPVTVISTISGQSTTTQIVTNTTATPQITETSTVTQTDATTISSSVSSSVQTAACSYFAIAYNNEESIDGISGGLGVDSKNCYVGITKVNGTILPGNLQTKDSIGYGLSYAYNGQFETLVKSSVSYLVPSPGCSCYFIPSTDPLPDNSILVSLNDAPNQLGVGSSIHHDNQYNLTSAVIGRIENGIFYYYNGFDGNEVNVTNYNKLVCSPNNIPITTISPSGSTNSTSTSSDPATQLATLNAKIDALETQLVSNDAQIASVISSFDNEIQALINDSTTLPKDIPALQQLHSLLTENPNNYTGARRKRQAASTVVCDGIALSVQNLQNFLSMRQSIYSYYTSFLNRIFQVYAAAKHLRLPSDVSISLALFNGFLKIMQDDTKELKLVLTALKILQTTVCPTTPSQSTTFATTKAPTCSYGVKTYNGETSINGIISGQGVDGSPIYAGFTTVNGIIVPGSLQTSNTIGNGLCYAYGNQHDCFVTKNVSYIVNTPDCNCYFINKDDPIPNNGYLVTFNDGANLFGVGVFSLSNAFFNMSLTATGTIDVNSNSLYYFNAFNLIVSTTTNFTKLICAPPSSTTSSSSVSTTTAFQVTNPSAQFANLTAQSVLIQTGLAAIDTELVALFGALSLQFKSIIINPLTDAATVTALQQFVAILDQDPSTYTTLSPARRKRQTVECAADTLVEQNLESYLQNRQPRILYYNNFHNRIFKVYQSYPNMTIPATFPAFDVSFNGLLNQLNDNTNNLNTILSQMKILLPYICNPPTTTTSIPSICTYFKDLKAANNGTYLKTLCWVNRTLNYDDAKSTCQGNLMQLFAITDDAESIALKSALASYFGQNTGISIWINGQQVPIIGSWVGYLGLIQVNILNTDWPSSFYSNTLNRMQITNSGGAFVTKAADPTATASFICETLTAIPYI